MKAQGVKRLAALFLYRCFTMAAEDAASHGGEVEKTWKGRPPAFHFKSPILSRRPRGGCSLHRALCSSSTSLRLINDWLAPMKVEQLRQYDSVTLLLCGDWMRQNRGCSCCTMMRLGEEINGRQNRCSARWPKLLFKGPAQVGKLNPSCPGPANSRRSPVLQGQMAFQAKRPRPPASCCRMGG